MCPVELPPTIDLQRPQTKLTRLLGIEGRLCLQRDQNRSLASVRDAPGPPHRLCAGHPMVYLSMAAKANPLKKAYFEVAGLRSTSIREEGDARLRTMRLPPSSMARFR